MHVLGGHITISTIKYNTFILFNIVLLNKIKVLYLVVDIMIVMLNGKCYDIVTLDSRYYIVMLGGRYYIVMLDGRYYDIVMLDGR